MTPLLLLLLQLPIFWTEATTDIKNKEVSNFLEEYLLWKLEVNPEFASLQGHHEHDSELADTFPVSAERAKMRCVQFKRRARSITRVS